MTGGTWEGSWRGSSSRTGWWLQRCSTYSTHEAKYVLFYLKKVKIPVTGFIRRATTAPASESGYIKGSQGVSRIGGLRPSRTSRLTVISFHVPKPILHRGTRHSERSGNSPMVPEQL